MANPEISRHGFLTVMRVIAAAELVSLLVILINRFTVHIPAITSSGGPIHGLLYVSTIVLALLLPFPRSAKWLAVIPGIGGLLALRRARAVQATAPAGPASAGVGGVLTDADRDGAVVIVDGASATLSRTVTVGPLVFSVPRAGITGLIGPNGAGKTTALRMLCGLVASDVGSITVRDRDSAAASPMGVLIDSPGFIPGLTARANLLALTRLAGWSPLLVEQALDRAGLSKVADRRMGTFSLGMKQRLGLAAALLGQPSVVILDEPTNGLDPRGAIELRGFLRSLAAEGITVIIASHALDEIEELCDHLVAIDGGAVVFNGTPRQMIEQLPAGIRCAAADATALAIAVDAFRRDGLSVHLESEHAAFVLGDPDIGIRVNRLAGAAGVLLSEISPHRPTVQNAFLALIGDDDGGASHIGRLAAHTLTAVAR